MTTTAIQPQALARMVAWRRHLHTHPELSGQEYETREFLLSQLASMGIAAKTFSSHAGIVATIDGGGPGRSIALRADMDALPIQEANEVSYRSQRDGVMHACGHDSHMAILLGAALALQQSREKWAGTVRLLFQPSEEDAPRGGAPKMIADGALTGVEAIFGLHVWPELPYGDIGITRGPLMASSDPFSLTLTGASAHAGAPHQGTDAIMMSADVLTALSRIIHRRVDPRETATIAVGTIHGGERYNVVAKEVVLNGTVRTLNEAIRGQIPVAIRQMTEGICAGYGGSCKLDYQWGYPSLINSAAEAGAVILTASRFLGPEHVRTDIKPALGAEDFAFYTQKIPGAFFFLGCAAKDGPLRPLHNDCFDLDERAMYIGAQILEETALTALSMHSDAKEGKPANLHMPIHY
ncbi:MAG: amidohydrolase [Sporomusaceae bacterium]|nr:amidohydrolase [Sporomusaceae bacterium]